jgi:hypothetical protein
MLDIQGRKYAAVTVCDVTLYDLITKYPVMYFDTLQVTSIDGTTEVTEIQGGKGNSILASISHTKNIDVQFDDAIMTMSSLAVLTGGELNTASDTAKITMTQTEIVEVAKDATSITLGEAVKANSYVYIGKIIDGIVSTVTRTTDKVAGNTNAVEISEFYNFAAEGEDISGKYRVFYEYELGVEDGRSLSELTVLADKFAGTYRFIGDTMLFNQFTGLNDVFQIEIPRLKLDGAFSFSLNAAVDAVAFSFKGKALRDDFGKLIIFRNLTQEGQSGDANAALMDGAYKELPAKEVTMDESGKLVDAE